MTLDGAACKGMDTTFWFPDAPGNPSGYKTARPICAACPVKLECGEQAMRAEDGLDRRYRFGMFGGMSPNERYRRSRELAPTFRVCRVCDREFDHGPSARGWFCSPRCTKIHYAEYHRAYQRANRNNGLPNPIAKHGTVTMAKSGCKCAVCANHRRQLRRMSRLNAALREAS